MLVELAWKKYQDEKKRENYYHTRNMALTTTVAVFVILLLIAFILIIPMAIYFTLSSDYCGDRLPMWAKIILIIAYFLPYLGLPLAIMMIIVGLATCKKSRPALALGRTRRVFPRQYNSY